MILAILFLLFVLAFAVAAVTVLVASAALSRRSALVPAAGTKELATQGQLAVSANWLGDSPGLFKSDELSTISFWDDVLKRLDIVDLLSTRLAQAELNWSPGRVTLAMLLCGAVTLAMVWRVSFVPSWLALIIVPAASLYPYLYILNRRDKRFRRFKTLFPDALDSFARALRSGAPVAAGLEIVANESEAPVSTEIRKTFIEVSFGVPWNQALSNLSERIPLPEAALFVAALQIHSRTGGRLGEVMNRLAENMREQNSLEGEIRSIAAHGKLTGLVLTLVPIVIAMIMFVVSPGYVGVLIHHPYGGHLIAAALIGLVGAHFVIRKLVDIEI
jgi:tight adherence protein B